MTKRDLLATEALLKDLRGEMTRLEALCERQARLEARWPANSPDKLGWVLGDIGEAENNILEAVNDLAFAIEWARRRRGSAKS